MINYFLFIIFETSLKLSVVMKFVLKSKKNKDKSTEIFPPLFLKYVHVQMKIAKRRSGNDSHFTEDDRALSL